MKFHEGQQIFVCANLGGQIVRQKGIIIRVDEDGVYAGALANDRDMEYRNIEEYAFDLEGKSDHVWLEARMT
jgi:hypothetical protein